MVTSQQVTIPGEELSSSSMDRLQHYSWTQAEALSYVSLLHYCARDFPNGRKNTSLHRVLYRRGCLICKVLLLWWLSPLAVLNERRRSFDGYGWLRRINHERTASAEWS